MVNKTNNDMDNDNKRAIDFLTRTGTHLDVNAIGGFMFNIELKNSKGSHSFVFGMLMGDFEQPTQQNILSCLNIDYSVNYETFCANMGYKINSESEKAYNGIVKESEALQQMFTEEELNELYEIQTS